MQQAFLSTFLHREDTRPSIPEHSKLEFLLPRDHPVTISLLIPFSNIGNRFSESELLPLCSLLLAIEDLCEIHVEENPSTELTPELIEKLKKNKKLHGQYPLCLCPFPLLGSCWQFLPFRSPKETD